MGSRKSNSLRLLFIQTVQLLCLLVLATTVACSDPGNVPPDAGMFEQWFVGAGREIPAALQKITTAQIDSLLRVIRNGSPAGDQVVQIADTAGGVYTAGYRTPGHFRNDTLYPLIIYLHGGVGTTRADKGTDAYLMLGMLTDSMELFLASPSASREAPWWSARGLSRILQTLRFMTLHYPVNPEKVFLAGVSDGATGCWAAANTIAAPFAGFFAVSGFGGMLPRLGMELFNGNLMQCSLYNVNAGHDRLYPLEQVNRFLDDLENSGVGVKRSVYTDEEHGFDYRVKEAGVLCSLATAWSRSQTETVHWSFSTSLPVTLRSVAGMVPATTSTSGSLEIYTRNDTVQVRSKGLSELIVRVTGCGSNVRKKEFYTNGKVTRCSRITPDREIMLQYMKTTCFPIVPDGMFFRIPL